MKRLLPLLVAAALVAACSSAKHSPAAVDATPAADAEVPQIDLTTRAAQAICSALFRCCDADLAEYFAPYRANEMLADFRARLPPDATLDEPQCRTVVREMLDIVPLGDWARAADLGLVEYDAAAAGACIAALDSASCGEPVRRALWDSTCFGFAAPTGGSEQRAFVHRTRHAGDTCTPIRDGIGAAFYGTCDPTTAFCCYEDTAATGCQYPFDAEGLARTGRCRPVAAVDETCAIAAPLQLCATGVDCDIDTMRCTAPGQATLSPGEPCIDDSYHVLGECQDSYCDVLGTQRCESRRADGERCGGADECSSGRCETVCVSNTVCTDTTTPPPDAGVDAVPDGPPMDAPSSPETCTNAPALTAASIASPLAGYTWRVSGAFGTQDDYNPLMSSGLPPGCAYAYDARGLDVVYAITLDPGQRLELRAELAEGKQAAVYLLDACPSATWPDFDQSGACGSNEYAAGFCGPVGCDPATLNITYPTEIENTPTATATFWVVVDQVGGSDSSGFTLDWRITP